MKKILSILFMLALSSIAWGQDQHLSLDTPVGYLVTANSWTNVVPATGQVYIFRPVNPISIVSISLRNNNASNTHTATINFFTTIDPRLTDYSNNTSQWSTPASMITSTCLGGGTGPIASKGFLTCAFLSINAAQVAIKLFSADVQAGATDTFDIIVNQIPNQGQPVNGSLGSNTVAGSTPVNPFYQVNGLADTFSNTWQTIGCGTGGNAPVCGSFSLPYLFNGGTWDRARSTGIASETAAVNAGAILQEKGPRWSVVSTPAAGSIGSASKAAGGATIRHVADCVSFNSAATAGVAASAAIVSIRDGASGAGTIIWSQYIALPAAANGVTNPINICGLNLPGSLNTAMTAEFNSAFANLDESATLTGYDIQ